MSNVLLIQLVPCAIGLFSAGLVVAHNCNVRVTGFVPGLIVIAAVTAALAMWG